MLYKNMPLLQILLNLPFLVLGFAVCKKCGYPVEK